MWLLINLYIGLSVGKSVCRFSLFVFLLCFTVILYFCLDGFSVINICFDINPFQPLLPLPRKLFSFMGDIKKEFKNTFIRRLLISDPFPGYPGGYWTGAPSGICQSSVSSRSRRLRSRRGEVRETRPIVKFIFKYIINLDSMKCIIVLLY